MVHDSHGFHQFFCHGLAYYEIRKIPNFFVKMLLISSGVNAINRKIVRS